MAVKATGVTRAFTQGNQDWIAENSLVVKNGELMYYDNSTGLDHAAAGESITGVAVTDKTFASGNFATDQERCLIVPTDDIISVTLPINEGYSIVFSGDLVTSNTINMDVNGTAMTQVTFSDDNATTLAAIATQLTTDFPLLIKNATAVAASDTIFVTPQAGVTLVIDSIVVAAGAGQATGAFAANITIADEGKYYDIDTVGVDGSSESATTGQVRLVRYDSPVSGEFEIVNA